MEKPWRRGGGPLSFIKVAWKLCLRCKGRILVPGILVPGTDYSSGVLFNDSFFHSFKGYFYRIYHTIGCKTEFIDTEYTMILIRFAQGPAMINNIPFIIIDAKRCY